MLSCACGLRLFIAARAAQKGWKTTGTGISTNRLEFPARPGQGCGVKEMPMKIRFTASAAPPALAAMVALVAIHGQSAPEEAKLR